MHESKLSRVRKLVEDANGTKGLGGKAKRSITRKRESRAKRIARFWWAMRSAPTCREEEIDGA